MVAGSRELPMICHQLAESVEEAGEHQNMHAETRALVRSPLPFPFSVFASHHVEPGGVSRLNPINL